jgi:spermidine/putrescine transport system substrate-binding protein
VAARGFRQRDALTIAGLVGLGGLTAACAAQPIRAAPQPSPQDSVAAFWARQRKHGHVNFANWPLYIDPGHQTLQDFTATGITVNYAEVIQDDESWYDDINPILRPASPSVTTSWWSPTDSSFPSWCRRAS